MKNVPASGVTTTGVDLSHWDPQVNWDMIKAAGVGFIILKATEGTGSTDQSFQKNWAAAKQHGVIRGAYHFFHPSQDPEVQATHFVKTVGKLDSGDLPPIIDWESTDNEAAKVDVGRGLVFLQAVEKALGKKPICYGGPYFLQALKGSKDLAQYPLWVAHYGVRAPLVPPPWSSWQLWQYSDRAAVPGIGPAGHGTCDANHFNGTLADLKSFIAQSSVTPAPAVASAPKAQPNIEKEKLPSKKA